MKYLLIALAVLCSSCSSINPELKNALSYGEIKELNNYSPDIDKQLIIRLFEAPTYVENCFKETHGVCQYQYFLSVSTFDEEPETNIFPLRTKGEIRDIEWKSVEGIDIAKINFTLNKYTQEALSNNSELVNFQSIIQAVITPKALHLLVE